jgi:hypothetical protein
VEENGWRLGQPHEGEWWIGDPTIEQIIAIKKTDWRKFGRAYPDLPGKYFPREDIDAFMRKNVISNFFYASYPLNSTTDIAFWIALPDTLEIKKTLYIRTFTHNIVDEYTDIDFDYAKHCRRSRYADIVITFNAVDVEFDSSSIYFTKDGKKIEGDEMISTYRNISWKNRKNNTLKYEFAIHNLSSPSTIKSRQPTFRQYRNRPLPFQNYPTFHYNLALSYLTVEK